MVLFHLTATACIWDAESLSHEKSRSHDLAQTILGTQQVLEDTNKLRSRIKELEANRQESDPNWWNNLAGAYLRLGQPESAVELLEPAAQRFSDGYGIHANLGTAYHLLGRYQDAEKEIARDLEINPNAHFGLEKYHLALLQYLVRDGKYQSRHVYVDEMTATFLASYYGGRLEAPDRADANFTVMATDYTNGIAEAEADYESLLKAKADDYKIANALGTVAALDTPPAYRAKWNLGTDTNFENGVIYMAQMNPREPACLTMLGVAAWAKRDYHLAVSAFEKAIAADSPQTELLNKRIEGLRHHISESAKNDITPIVDTFFGIIGVLIIYLIYSHIRRRRRAASNVLG